MLEPFKYILNARRIILASGSPRRKEVLDNIGLKFEVIPSIFEENLDPASYHDPSDFVIDTAAHKVEEVYERLKNDAKKPDLIIGADTVVVFESQIYGKPKSEDHAFEMLKKFCGKSQFVYTGIVLKTNKETVKFFEKSEVTFGELTDEMIKAYIKTGEPMDKAGGYGIQSIGGTLVKSVNGDYFNIVGFPVYHFCKQLVGLVERSKLE
ncbi:probable bifunctional dTTP/UTP pyrophosphatase/methyltransferase protein [Neocloeon triangulifer]|uniref:probable bifunctional dTTP/UTP pyrophosphatase/methyltransferase protein n=1 Tax=Neocloeon triangulifer TaxID=2078957 RepID=UPI00286EB73A|nr:probable bifunctional dTTP/UTP pyrophosphatase/methyltransferase protein [Neocloeon triangulifer]